MVEKKFTELERAKLCIAFIVVTKKFLLFVKDLLISVIVFVPSVYSLLFHQSCFAPKNILLHVLACASVILLTFDLSANKLSSQYCFFFTDFSCVFFLCVCVFFLSFFLLTFTALKALAFSSLFFVFLSLSVFCVLPYFSACSVLCFCKLLVFPISFFFVSFLFVF